VRSATKLPRRGSHLDVVPPREIEHMVVANRPAVGTAQPLLIQDAHDLRKDVRRRQGANTLNDLRVGAWCPGANFKPLDLSCSDRTGTPGHADVNLSGGSDPVELHLGDEIAKQLFTFPVGGAGSMPDGGEILRQAPNIVFLFIGYSKVRLGLGLLVRFLQVLHLSFVIIRPSTEPDS